MTESRSSLRDRQSAGRQRADTLTQQREALDQTVRENMPYLDAILPSHMNAAQFAAIVNGLLVQNDDLAIAAISNPTSFLAAMADCARLGLTPGDGYAFVPVGVNNANAKTEVVGMVEYTGEIALMYRTNLVEAVIAEVVFEHDHYVAGRHAHEPPEWSRGPSEFSTDAERGKPVGAFCYCILKERGPGGELKITRVVRMNREEIMLHREVAKTLKIWDGAFWRSMWLKTVTHEESKWTPKSAEYMIAASAASAALAGTPLGALPVARDAMLDDSNDRPVTSLTLRAIGSATQQADTDAGRATGRQRRRGRGYPRIVELFETIGCTEPAEQLALVKAVVPDYAEGEPISDKQAEPVIERLQSFIDNADEPGAESGLTPYDLLRDWLASPAGTGEDSHADDGSDQD